jgi:hypothetical protein
MLLEDRDELQQRVLSMKLDPEQEEQITEQELLTAL